MKVIGGFSLVMTGLHLWRVGFLRFEGADGETWVKVLSILTSYAIMGLISRGIFGLGNYLGTRPAQKEMESPRKSYKAAQQRDAGDVVVAPCLMPSPLW